MTISTTTNRISYSGNGSTTSFATGFKFFASSDLTVILVTDSTGAEATQTITTNYTVSGAGNDSGGTVTMVTAPAIGETLVIVREQPYTQGLDLVENDPFPSDSVEETLDKTVIMAQQNNDAIIRSLRLSDGFTASFDITLPTNLSTANATLIVNSAGDGFDMGPTTTEIANAESNATAASASASAASTSASNAATSETNAAASEAAAAAAAQGWAAVVSVTNADSPVNIEIADANKYYIIDASAGAVTMNLPAVGTEDGLTIAFEVLDATNAITIARDGTDTINGVAGDYTSLTGVGDVVHFIAIDGTPDNWSARLISRFIVDDVTIGQNGRTIQIKDDGVTPAKVAGAVNAQTGTTYALVLTDDHKIVTMTNAGANTLTVPTNASVAFPVGAKIDVVMGGAGVTTITGDTGVTVNGVSAGSAALSAQYVGASLIKTATDTWLLVGSHGGVA